MTTYAMETRGTQHVRPRPRVRIEADRRPQAHPARRHGGPVARPDVVAPFGGPAAVTAHACRVPQRVARVPRAAADGALRLTDRGIAVVSGLFLSSAAVGVATVVMQLFFVPA